MINDGCGLISVFQNSLIVIKSINKDIVVHKEFCSSLLWNSTTSHWKGHKAGEDSHHVSVVKV